MNAKAWVIEPTKVDVRQAEAYGSITYVFDKGETRVSIWDVMFTDSVLDALDAKGFNPVRDYIVVTGNMVTLTLAITAMVSTYGSIRALLYSATERAYVLRLLGETTYDRSRRRIVRTRSTVSR